MKHFIIWDYDAAPTALFEVADLIRIAERTHQLAHVKVPKQVEEHQPLNPTEYCSQAAIITVTEEGTDCNAGIVVLPRRELPRGPYVKGNKNTEPMPRLHEYHRWDPEQMTKQLFRARRQFLVKQLNNKVTTF